MLGENFSYVGLKLGQTLVGGPGSQGFLEGTALVHCGSGDDSVFVRNVLHSLNFSRCKFQGILLGREAPGMNCRSGLLIMAGPAKTGLTF